MTFLQGGQPWNVSPSTKNEKQEFLEDTSLLAIENIRIFLGIPNKIPKKTQVYIVKTPLKLQPKTFQNQGPHEKTHTVFLSCFIAEAIRLVGKDMVRAKDYKGFHSLLFLEEVINGSIMFLDTSTSSGFFVWKARRSRGAGAKSVKEIRMSSTQASNTNRYHLGIPPYVYNIYTCMYLISHFGGRPPAKH